jgi:hypothetical protein
MDQCLRQFEFQITKGQTFGNGTGDFASWSTTSGISWVINNITTASTFAIQGFKNINLYGIKMRGNVFSPILTSAHGIVEDYSLNFSINGTPPSISGVFTANDYAADPYNNAVRLGKYQDEIMFSEPIQSVTQISINTFSAQGSAAELLTDVRLNLIFQIYFFYKFEGEGEDLLF